MIKKNYSSRKNDMLFRAEQKELKRAKRMQNIALLTDLATNLASIIARNKGARYTVATNLSPKMPPYVRQAKERLRAAQNDYNGVIANFYLRGVDSNNIAAHKSSTPRFISQVDVPYGTNKNKNFR